MDVIPLVYHKHHTILQLILPKGTSFEFLTQSDINTIANHINSTPRESLGEETLKADPL